MVIIGIDPGLTGALAVCYDTGYSSFRDMPTFARGNGRVKRVVNVSDLSELISLWIEGYDKNEIMVYLETQTARPGQGVAGVFSLGHTLGCIEGVIAAKGLEVSLVRPAEWKKSLKLGKDKGGSLAMARKLFPDAKLHLKKHHNRAEALLIAHYGWIEENS